MRRKPRARRQEAFDDFLLHRCSIFLRCSVVCIPSSLGLLGFLPGSGHSVISGSWRDGSGVLDHEARKTLFCLVNLLLLGHLSAFLGVFSCASSVESFWFSAFSDAEAIVLMRQSYAGPELVRFLDVTSCFWTLDGSFGFRLEVIIFGSFFCFVSWTRSAFSCGRTVLPQSFVGFLEVITSRFQDRGGVFRMVVLCWIMELGGQSFVR
ncbi:hypothetical protein MUK42_23523 [Musa troglodytarum]|uniref:Transmembrane protein n=1 Tax=Musa troglodytarum TaxID=320322 RepID=A0A9E7GE39_9LILI|nr:hypothetical protein MUK42_23523 [Musa troglodytarum]